MTTLRVDITTIEDHALAPLAAIVAEAGREPRTPVEHRAFRALTPFAETGDAAAGAESLTAETPVAEQIRFPLADRVNRGLKAVLLGIDAQDVTIVTPSIARLDPGTLRALALAERMADAPAIVIEVDAGPAAPAPGAVVPGDSRTTTLRARGALHRGNPWAAYEVVGTAGSSPTAETLITGALCSVALDRPVEARAWYLGALELGDPLHRAAAHYGLAMAALRHGAQWARSLNDGAAHLDAGLRILQAAGHAPDSFPIVFNRNGYALVEYRKGRVEEACALLEHGLSALPATTASERLHKSVLQYNLAQCLVAMGALDAAVAAYEKLCALDPNMAENHLELARTRTQAGDLTGAVAAAEHAADLDPTVQEAHAMLGFLAWSRDDVAAAAVHYRAAWALDLAAPDIATDYASVLIDADAPREAANVLDRVPVSAWARDAEAAERMQALRAAARGVLK